MGDAQQRTAPPRERWLNLGCGDDYREGWDNVDALPEAPFRVDRCATVKELGAQGMRYSRVLCSHMLEHVPFGWVIEELRQIAGVLVPRGEVVFVVPDITKLPIGAPPELVRRIVYGTGRHEFDHHLWAPTGAVMMALLSLANFVDVRVLPAYAAELRDWKIRDRDNAAQTIVYARTP